MQPASEEATLTEPPSATPSPWVSYLDSSPILNASRHRRLTEKGARQRVANEGIGVTSIFLANLFQGAGTRGLHNKEANSFCSSGRNTALSTLPVSRSCAGLSQIRLWNKLCKTLTAAALFMDQAKIVQVNLPRTLPEFAPCCDRPEARGISPKLLVNMLHFKALSQDKGTWYKPPSVTVDSWLYVDKFSDLDDMLMNFANGNTHVYRAMRRILLELSNRVIEAKDGACDWDDFSTPPATPENEAMVFASALTDAARYLKRLNLNFKNLCEAIRRTNDPEFAVIGCTLYRKRLEYFAMALDHVHNTYCEQAATSPPAVQDSVVAFHSFYVSYILDLIAQGTDVGRKRPADLDLHMAIREKLCEARIKLKLAARFVDSSCVSKPHPYCPDDTDLQFRKITMPSNMGIFTLIQKLAD